MAKHTLKEILGIFASHVGHTHEAAVQATYDAGHARAREELSQGLGAQADPPAVQLMPNILMPDGTLRDGLAFMHTKSQSEWTEEESKQVAALQQETLDMQARLAGEKADEDHKAADGKAPEGEAGAGQPSKEPQAAAGQVPAA